MAATFRPIVRIDLSLNEDYQIVINAYTLAYRELFVYLVALKKYSPLSAMDLIQRLQQADKHCECSKDFDVLGISWKEIDNKILDSSKTFINGQFYV